jgi:hypothetical protein
LCEVRGRAEHANTQEVRAVDVHLARRASQAGQRPAGTMDRGKRKKGYDSAGGGK